MPSVLMVGTGEKAAGDRVRFAADFGNEPLIKAGRTITTFNVTCSGAGAPSVTAKQIDYAYQISGLFVGGSAGTYEAVFSITLNDTDATTIVRTGIIKVY